MTPLGDGALRLPLPPGTDRAAGLAALRALVGVTDAVIAEESAAVFHEPGAPPDLTGFEWPRSGAATGRVHRVKVVYDGDDLATVAALVGVSEIEVIRLHARAYDVRFMGFLPGFAYLGDLDPKLRVPRRATPRVRVPAGSVGIAGARTGIYPLASPGGWWLLGRAEGTWFDDRGARLAVGDRVHLEPA